MVRTALVIGIALAAGCGRLAEHPLAIEAAQEVKANERVAALLGKPIECSRTVRGTANETDGIARLEFEAAGSKTSGSVVVEGKKTRGTWGVTKLEVQPAGGEPLSLTADLVARTGTDTPTFDPSAAAAKPSATPPPPDEIEITLPPGPPGQ